MMTDPIKLLLNGEYPDPDGEGKIGVPTRSVVIEKTLAGREADLIADLNLSRNLAVIYDPDTHAVLGERVEKAAASLGKSISVKLGARPHADKKTVDLIREAASDADVLIAVGSGTINDLCKYSAALDGKKYAVFGTAPSMNGYTSVNAAITVDGLKKTLPATAASGVFLDLTVLSNAPKRMILSGLGDSVCRPTAQADWLLTRLLFNKPYRSAPFEILAGEEPGLFESAAALTKGDLEAMRLLARTLVLSGFGMTICGGSYPASQGEHLISHYIDMFGPPDMPESFHGEHIGVTAVTMAHIQERVLEAPGVPLIKPCSLTENDFVNKYGDALGRTCYKEFAAKMISPDIAENLNSKLKAHWNDYKEKLKSVSKASSEIENILKNAGAPYRPDQIGVPETIYNDAVLHAREIRDRFTFLDFASETGYM